MSAFDNLVELFRAGGPHKAFSAEECVRIALDEHAHGLAEKIRAEARKVGEAGGPYTFGLNKAADMIDPEVEK